MCGSYAPNNNMDCSCDDNCCHWEDCCDDFCGECGNSSICNNWESWDGDPHVCPSTSGLDYCGDMDKKETGLKLLLNP